MTYPSYARTNMPRRRRRRSHGRSRRRYRRNPGGGSRRSVALRGDPIQQVMAIFKEAFSSDALETLVVTGFGFGGVAAGSRLLYNTVIPALDTPIGRIGTSFGSTIVGTAAVGFITKNARHTTRFLTGGLLATLWQVLSEVLPQDAKEFIPTLGNAESAEFRKAIEQEVLKSIRRGASSGDGMSYYLQPAGVEYLPAAGSEAYFTAHEGEVADERRAVGMDAYLTEHNFEAAEAGMGDLVESEFGGKGMSERF